MLSEKNSKNRTAALSSFGDTSNVLKELQTRATNLNDRYHYKLLSTILVLMEDDIDFIELLSDYYWDDFPFKYNLKKSEFKNKEMKKLGDLIRNLDLSDENQTMAFNNVPIDEIYDKRIVKASNFTLNRPSNLNYDFRSTITLYYDIVLPFHDKNYDPTSTDCAHYRDLPTFFVGS